MFGNNPRKNPTLPQNDGPREAEKRGIQLAESKTVYIWDSNFKNVQGVPMSRTVPVDDKPTLEWFIETIEIVLQVAENALLNFVDGVGDEVKNEISSIRKKVAGIKANHEKHDSHSILSLLEDVLNKAKQLISSDILHASAELDRLISLIKGRSVKIDSSKKGLEKYKDLFNSIKLDPIAESFQTDSTFAYYRVGGPNPMLIQQMKEIPANFPVTEAGYQSVMGSGDSLQKALKEQRLYYLDYKDLKLIVDNPGFYDGMPKQLFAPLALFAVPVGEESLVPVAIQRDQNADGYGIVYAVKEGDPSYWQWQMAKSIVQTADGNYHELFVHLARTHLVEEAFAVATHRNLASSHPINILLLPHFEGTLFINNSAAESLIAKDGPIDQIFAGEIDKTQLAAGTDRLQFDFYKNMLPADLKERGVDDKTKLPEFPYRDDALLVWHAIHKWVTEYVNIYYSHDDEVQGDTELAAWTADLMTEGKITGFKPISSKEQLSDVLTMVIFTASAQHAAVNFPQSSIMTYAPAVSGAIWGEKNPKGVSEEQWLETLPPLKLASEQLNLLHILGGVYYRPLGNYQTNHFPYLSWFEDDKITGKGNALDRFKQALSEIDSKIECRNEERKQKGQPAYKHLMPKYIPTSINI